MHLQLHASPDLSPLPRLSAGQLHALASSLRREAGQGDLTADSVAAALESVSRRRAARAPLQRLRHASESLLRWTLRVAVTTQQTARPQHISSSKKGSSAMSKLPSASVRQALRAVEKGEGLAPEVCDALTVQGLAEWVDHQHGTPIDMNHPRSLLRITPEGQLQLSIEHAS